MLRIQKMEGPIQPTLGVVGPLGHQLLHIAGDVEIVITDRVAECIGLIPPESAEILVIHTTGGIIREARSVIRVVKLVRAQVEINGFTFGGSGILKVQVKEVGTEKILS